MDNNNSSRVATAMEETWVPARINGLSADLYEVSSEGNVRVKEHVITLMCHGKLSTRLCKSHLLKPSDIGLGYMQVHLYINGQYKAILVHRLVMESFNPNYDDSLTDVDHIDNNSLNNRLDNLRRLTHADNLRKEHRASQFKKPVCKKPVRVISANHEKQWLFDSVTEAADFLEVKREYLSHVLHYNNKVNGYFVYFK